MPTFRGDVMKINPEQWIRNDNTYTAKGHGTPVQFVNAFTGDTQLKFFSRNGSFFQDNNTISFMPDDIMEFFPGKGAKGAASAEEAISAEELLPLFLL